MAQPNFRGWSRKSAILFEDSVWHGHCEENPAEQKALAMIVEAQIAPSAAAHSDVLTALHTASTKTGADFDYLLATAMRESNLDVEAKSKASSATGLFQFVEQTWLGLVKRFGDHHGLSNYADAIRETDDGHYTVAGRDTRSAILALRKDPALSSLMAGEAANETKQSLEGVLGREVCSGELYAAHFLGAGGARHLIELKDTAPGCAADVAFPQAAKANRSAFYNADGTPKRVDELYAWVVDLPEVPDAVPGATPVPTAIIANDIHAARAPLPEGRWPSATSDRDVSQLRFAGQPGRDLLQTPLVRFSMGRAILADPTKQNAMLPQSPLLLSPAIVEILASLAPGDTLSGKRSV
jgi:hypothetical protein